MQSRANIRQRLLTPQRSSKSKNCAEEVSKMKKILSIMLSLTLLLSMSVTAFAEETATQNVSVSIPDYPYTVTFPASQTTIEYGNTGNQKIGEVAVSSTAWDTFKANKKHVRVYVSGNGKLMNQNEKEISCDFGIAYPPEMNLSGNDWWSCQSNCTYEYFIKISDWSSAEPGTRYLTTITYTATVGDTIN